jgi:hypothetical protein
MMRQSRRKCSASAVILTIRRLRRAAPNEFCDVMLDRFVTRAENAPSMR